MRTALIILDGMGLSVDPAGNAVTPQSMPFLFSTLSSQGFALLDACGEAVGLRPGIVGNSEVGHLTIGAGRTITSTLSRTDAAHSSGAWKVHPLWKHIAAAGTRLHVIGLLSDAGVHAHLDTIWRSASLALANGVPEVIVHLLLDGVDSPSGSAGRLLEELAANLAHLPQVKIGLVMGRKWFCDRGISDEPARFFADALAELESLPSLVSLEGIREEHSFAPHVYSRVSALRSGEPVLLTSHRADRAIQAARVLAESYSVYSLIPLGNAVSGERAFFPADRLSSILTTELAQAGLKTSRIAESCKFPHVTTFFDGLDESIEARRFSIPSLPEDDLRRRPEMEIQKVVRTVVSEMELSESQFLVANIANLDQIGHLGRLDLAKVAAKHVDAAAQMICEAAARTDWSVFLLSDHGNADQMETADGQPFGSHTDRPVPFTILPGPDLRCSWRARSGTLANVAATVLASLDLPIPSTMKPPLLAFTSIADRQQSHRFVARNHAIGC